jgi:hypothetical protein
MKIIFWKKSCPARSIGVPNQDNISEFKLAISGKPILVFAFGYILSNPELQHSDLEYIENDA